MENNNNNPKVSVIIPVYNGANYITETLNSVLIQAYKNIEVIVVNDGSTDKTEEIVKSFGDRIRYFVQKNKGVSSARNFGLLKAEGEYVQFLDADDLLFEDKIFNQIEFFIKNPSNNVVYCRYNLINSSGKIISIPKVSSLLLNPKCAYEDFLFKWQRPLSIPIHSFLFKSVCFKKIKFPEGFSVCEDWIVWIKIAREKHLFSFNDFIGVSYRIHKNNISQKKELSFYNAILAISFIRENLVDENLLEKFDVETARYLKFLAKYMFGLNFKHNFFMKTISSVRYYFLFKR